MRRSRLFAFAVLSVLFSAALLWASTGLLSKAITTAGTAAGEGVPAGRAEGEAGASDRLRRIRVRPGLREAFDALGERMVKPGKERLILTANLTRKGGDVAPVQIVLETPGLLRVEEGGPATGRTHALVFDGSGARRLGGDVSRADEELIETLVYDSPEHFFQGQLKGSATRLLGSGFRPDDGEAAEYKGPTYSIYQTTELVSSMGKSQEQVKLYYFNSATHLLEQVKYETERDGTRTSVAVLLGDWQGVQGQRVPGRVVRTEDGKLVLEVKVISASFLPRAQDGIFGLQQN